jgi:hypothetical protein
MHVHCALFKKDREHAMPAAITAVDVVSVNYASHLSFIPFNYLI